MKSSLKYWTIVMLIVGLLFPSSALATSSYSYSDSQSTKSFFLVSSFPFLVRKGVMIGMSSGEMRIGIKMGIKIGTTIGTMTTGKIGMDV
ncbi:hypothetical protein DOE78_20680 [Bacillus sp. Y1]|nr:hypothetical protein [Bacillus sp. Y1]AYA77644.1 hypothetical protein DOE78_20680 [Bacillus sp. Y1]